MKCENCKFEIPIGEAICPVCGTDHTEKLKKIEKQTKVTPEMEALEKKCHKLGRLSFIFAIIGYFTFVFGILLYIPSIILSIISAKLAKKLQETGYYIEKIKKDIKLANLGKGLSIIALTFWGIVLLVALINGIIGLFSLIQ